MAQRFLFGPVSARFAEENLTIHRQRGECLAFNSPGDGDLNIAPADSWEAVATRFPADWLPDFIVLSLGHTAIPECLWSAPVPIVGLAADWPVLFHEYRRCLSRCDLVLTDARGAEALGREGFDHVQIATWCGLGQSWFSTNGQDHARDIDVLFAANLQSAVCAERLPLLPRLAALSERWRVRLEGMLPGEEYQALLRRARIVVNPTLTGTVNTRAFEIAAAGALVFHPADDGTVGDFLIDGEECIRYRDREEELEKTLDQYLTQEDKRWHIADAGRRRVQAYSFAALWDKTLAAIDSRLPTLAARAQQRRPLAGRFPQERMYGAALAEDLDLRHAQTLAALRGINEAADKTRLTQQIVTDLRDIVERAPHRLVTAMTLVELLAILAQKKPAADLARRTLAFLQKTARLTAEMLQGERFPFGFDPFRVAWERAAWQNAGNTTAEYEAKRRILVGRLHSLLADLTGDFLHFQEAVLIQPEAPFVRAALGCALGRQGRAADGIPHLRAAIQANPLDLPAVRALHQAYCDAGDTEAASQMAGERRLFHQAAPKLVPAEPWFNEPKPSAEALASLVILMCDQADYTRRCLESVVRHTRSPFELILVDNASADDTPALLAEVSGWPQPARVQVIRNDTNRGFAAGCNQGLAEAQGRFVVFLNNDTLVGPGWLEGLIGWSLHDWPQVGLVGPVSNYVIDEQRVDPGCTDLDNLASFTNERQRQFQRRAKDTGRLSGFCLLGRRELLNELGGFDERFGPGFFEDDDLCLRMRNKGRRLLVALNVYVHHFGSRTFQALGLDTENQLRVNFDKFQAKWGQEASAGYQVPKAWPVPTRCGGPPVSLCMIVKNEEHNLPDCLRSIADLVDEIIIVDTGSTDRTKEIAAEFGAKVFDFPWVDSFSAARNETLRHATGDWLFWMDADDRIDDVNRQRLRDLFATLQRNNLAYVMNCRCLGGPGENATDVTHIRLFPRLPGLQWEHRIHEQILPSLTRRGAKASWTDIEVTHTGYADAAVVKRKQERDLRLLMVEKGEMKDHPFTLFNLGSTYMELGLHQDAIPVLRRSLEQSAPSDSITRKLFVLLSKAHARLGQSDDAMAACLAGRKHFARDAELLFQEARLREDQGDLAGAVHCLETILQETEERYFASTPEGMRGPRVRHALGLLAWKQGDLDKAERWLLEGLAEAPKSLALWTELGQLRLARKQWAELQAGCEAMDEALGETMEAGVLRARGQLARQEVAAAIEALQRNCGRYPKAVWPRVILSHALLQQGTDFAAAEAVLQDLLTLDPHNQEAKKNLAVLQRQGKDGLRPSPPPNVVVEQRGEERPHTPAVSIESDRQSARRRILVLCPDFEAPSGGVRKLYLHVDVLNQHGIPAFILHEREGFRCTWFNNQTPVVYAKRTPFNAQDVVVIPEVLGPAMARQAQGIPKVIYNQNAYLTFQGYNLDLGDMQTAYTNPEVVAALVISENNRQYLEYAFPNLRMHRLHYGIDTTLFDCRAEKRQRIAFMPRKNAAEVVQVINLLKHRGSLAGFELVAIDNVPEAEVAHRLRDCLLFLSFGYPEGCPLPPLEAMASGCVVVGYHGWGGQEYFHEDFCYPVEVGDVVRFAQAVEEALREYSSDPAAVLQKGQRAAAYVREHYSPKREVQDIIGCWQAILAGIDQRRATTAT